jgi:hypothetical protein
MLRLVQKQRDYHNLILHTLGTTAIKNTGGFVQQKVLIYTTREIPCLLSVHKTYMLRLYV